METRTEQTPSSRLYRRLSNLRWVVLSLGLLIVLLHQLLEGFVRRTGLPDWELIELVYGVLISISGWLILTWLRRSAGQTERVEHALTETLSELNQANQHQEILLQVSRRLAEAEDETSLVGIIIDIFLNETPAVACSLIRFDAQQRTLPLVYRRQGSPLLVDNQMAHFSAAEVSQKCQACSERWPQRIGACDLFTQPIAEPPAEKLHCLHLARGSQVYGTVGLCLHDTAYPDDQEQLLLEMMSNEMTMALESHALRSREMTMLNRLQKARRLSNLHDELAAALTDTVKALEVTGGLLLLIDETTFELQVLAEAGQQLGDSLELVKGLAGGANQAETPFVIGDLEQGTGSEGISLLIAPLRVGEKALGSLILWDAQLDAFTQRRTQLVATVAGQAALLIENHRLYLRGEHQAALSERARLSREIHDGLAQTLGYLKLRTAQISSWHEHGEEQLVETGLSEVQQLLGEAYVDTREAIDGLRLSTQMSDLRVWVHEIVAEFESLSNIPVNVAPVPDVIIAPEVHIQLQRIVQETFSNIRKHADATRVWLEWLRGDYWLTLHIRDNGCGFDLDDAPNCWMPISR
jgi:nitrate/nitrite-specific signal transduction histidine kinase